MVLLRFARYALEQASPKALVVGGGSLVSAISVGGLYYRQRRLQQHPICAVVTAQLNASKEVRKLFEGDTVSTDGYVGGYVDMNSGTAVLTLPVQTTGCKGIARVEAEAVAIGKGDAPSLLDFVFGADELRWTLRHLEVTKDAPVATPPQVLYSLPGQRTLPAWAPTGEPSAPRSLLSREAQAILPADTSMVWFGALHVVAVAVVIGWLRYKVRTERAHAALEALIQLPPEPWLLRLRALALRAEVDRAPPTTSLLLAPARLTPGPDDFYGGVFGREVGAYTRVNSPMGEVDLLLHAVRRGHSNAEWELVGSATGDPRDIEALLASTADDPDAARSAIFKLATSRGEYVPKETSLRREEQERTRKK